MDLLIFIFKKYDCKVYSLPMYKTKLQTKIQALPFCAFDVVCSQEVEQPY